MIQHARSPAAGHSQCFVRTLKLDRCRTRIPSSYAGIHSSSRGVLGQSSRGAQRCGDVSHRSSKRNTQAAALSGIEEEPRRPVMVDLEAEPSGSGAEFGMSSSGRPPNPFQRLALIIGRLGLHCMRFGQMVGSRIMGGLIQGMRGLLRLRGKSMVWGLMFMLGMALVSGFASVPGVRYSAVPQEVVYSEFLDLVNTGNVRQARIDESLQKVYFSVRPLQPAEQQDAAAEASTSGMSAERTAALQRAQKNSPPHFVTKRVADPNMIPMLVAAGVEFGAVKATMTGALARVVGTTLALWLPLVPLYLFVRHAISSRSPSRTKKGASNKLQAPPVTFRDVAGLDTAKEELLEVVACLRDARRYARLNAKTPSGVLLTGPPGTGKTLLAKAVAGEAGVPFFAAAASEFVELFVGRGAARIRDLFAEARKRAPCVVFIDELDAVGGRRGIGTNEERDQTLNQLLTELDGFEGRPGVLLLAATNRPEVLDPALTRPGRLSRRVVVPLPDERGRADILAVHMRVVPLAPELDRSSACRALAKITGGFSGAELANVVNEAALLAGRKEAEVVGMSELVEATQRTRFGVNGGQASVLSGPRNWVRRLNDAVLDSVSRSSPVRATPMGQS
ncbi:g5605 [Coccomyxa viridis]|uniref:G5605 protein n=1 Tax=Coccomyxa viridis TaxID=1274662 RepID=A0ABP1FX75_9CHLO